MHKKRILLTGTIIILSVLFLNIVFSDRSAKTSLTLANIEAMAEQESPDGERKDLCLQAGYICVGIDKNGIDGEDLNLLVGSIPYDKEITEAVKLNILNILNEKYELQK